jgi:hypothetical protein
MEIRVEDFVLFGDDQVARGAIAFSDAGVVANQSREIIVEPWRVECLAEEEDSTSCLALGSPAKLGVVFAGHHAFAMPWWRLACSLELFLGAGMFQEEFVHLLFSLKWDIISSLVKAGQGLLLLFPCFVLAG